MPLNAVLGMLTGASRSVRPHHCPDQVLPVRSLRMWRLRESGWVRRAFWGSISWRWPLSIGMAPVAQARFGGHRHRSSGSIPEASLASARPVLPPAPPSEASSGCPPAQPHRLLGPVPPDRRFTILGSGVTSGLRSSWRRVRVEGAASEWHFPNPSAASSSWPLRPRGRGCASSLPKTTGCLTMQ